MQTEQFFIFFSEKKEDCPPPAVAVGVKDGPLFNP